LSEWREHVAAVRAACAPLGFDLVQAFRLEQYNGQVQGALALTDWGLGAHLGVVIGNTRQLWTRFLSALRADAALLASPDPLDAYVERALGSVVANLRVETDLRFAHDGGSRLVAMQRLASASGLAYLSESHLSVHPEYGPWIGLRAAISLRVPGPERPAAPLEHPCGSCRNRCWPAYRRALEARPQNGSLWLACRDACPTGRGHRYGEDQIRYHYEKDRQRLRALVRGSH
jgi:methylmalonic aciduria homocystinuria type C protein